MTRRLKLAVSLLAVFMALLLASLLGGGYLLLATEDGSRWLLEKATRQAGIEMSWQEVSGTLLDGMQFWELEIRQPELTINADRVSGRWQLSGLFSGTLQIGQLQLDNLVITESPSGAETPPSPWPALTSPLPVALESVLVTRLHYRAPDSQFDLDELAVSGEINLLGIRFDHLTLKQPEGLLDVAGQIGGQAPYRLKLEADWQWSTSDQPHYAGKLSLDGNLADIQVRHQLLSPLALESEGRIETGFNPQSAALDPGHFQLDLQHRWQLDNTPLPGLDEAVTTAGKATSRGTLDDYQLEAQLKLLLPEQFRLPELQLALAGSGTPDVFSLDSLELNSDVVSLTARGEVSLKDIPTGQVQVELSRLDPGHFFDGIKGELAGSIHLQGSYVNQQWQATAAIDRLVGQLNDYPLELGGVLAYRDGDVSSDGLGLNVGDNRLLLAGKLGEQLQLRWQLDAPNLQALLPTLAGRLMGNGTISGNRESPELAGSLHGEQVVFKDYRAGRIDLAINRQTGRHFNVQLNGQQLGLSGIPVHRFTLKTEGLPDNHRYVLDAEHPRGTLHLEGTGQWQDDTWNTDLQNGAIQSEPLESWELSAPVHGQLALSGIEVEQHCWQQQAANICGRFQWHEPGAISLDGTLRQLPASLLHYWLPQQQLTGNIDGELSLSGPADNLRGEFALHAPQLELNLATQSPHTLALKDNRLSASLREGVLEFTAGADLTNGGHLKGSLSWPLAHGEAISGEAALDLGGLEWLDPLLLQVDNLQGKAKGHVSIGGTNTSPQLSGAVGLTGLAAHIPALETDIKNGQLQLTEGQNHQWQIAGSMESGRGTLNLEGNLALLSLTDWQSQLQINGQDFQAIALDDFKAEISPQLTLKADASRIDVTGDVTVPVAEIRLRELPASAVTVSGDTVIVDAPVESAPQTTQAFYSAVNLSLGDSVQFQGFGIRGRLSGNLKIEESPGQPLLAKGILEIKGGTYHTYGQRLNIDTGRLIFQGDPDHPLLHMRASRQVEDTLVGIRIDGTPGALTSEVFSTPALPQTEAMALLMTGKPLSSASQADATTLTNAATALGFSQSEGLTRQLQNYLGLDTLTVSSDGGVEESALTIGKYLTPRLYVSYIQELMSPNAGVLLEYSITEKLKVKAESGESQSMDLLLRMEHP
ncbi:MAG: translocation/assembly module TamB domain-containing protein [Porticoccaceae bacterium]